MHIIRQQCNLLRFIKRQHDVIDYYADNYVFDNTYIGPRGVVVACNQTTFDKITTHAHRYYPNMIVTSMTIGECMARTQNRRNNDD